MAVGEAELLAMTKTDKGPTLAELSHASPVLLMLLRHEGCTFCRNAMSDIARHRRKIEGLGTRIVLGHMNSEETFRAFAQRYGLADLPMVSDPQRFLYRGLGLPRGNFWQILGPKVIWGGLKSVLAGHFPGKVSGDIFQLPGAFLLHHGQVVKAHRFSSSADRPDYLAFVAL